LRKPAGIVLSLLFLAASVLELPLQAQQQPDAARVNLLAENKSSSAAYNADRALALAPTNAAAAFTKARHSIRSRGQSIVSTSLR
jgi:hypothetical protein